MDLLKVYPHKKILGLFAALKRVFPNEINGVFIIPQEEFEEDSGYDAKINVAVSFKFLPTSQFLTYAANEDAKGIFHLWETVDDRNKSKWPNQNL